MKKEEAAAALAQQPPQQEKAEPPRGRGRGKRALIAVLVILGCLCAYIGANAWYSRTHFNIVFYQEVSPSVTENLRMVVITDLHSREYGEKNAELLAQIKALSPGLILLGGDIINRGDADYQPMLDLCRELADIAPLYGILGNHESERIYSLGDKELVERFESAGVRMLRNADELVTVGRNTIQLIGVEGTEAGFDMYGAKERLDAMEFRDDVYRVVLAHIPILFKSKLGAYPFDLGVAGHVHGGIVRLPGVGGLYSDEEKLLPEFCRGEYPLANGGSLIISGGMGDSSNIPRINNTPELVVIDVNWC